MKPTIFLDIDGVLVRPGKDPMSLYSFMGDNTYGLNRGLVGNLNRLAFTTGAEIVIHSTWRMIHSFSWLESFLRDQGVTGDIIGTTNVAIAGREASILDMSGRISREHVVIDDEKNAFTEYGRARLNIVIVPENKGLAPPHVSEAFQHLRSEDS